MIFIVDDDEIMAECVARATKCETKIFRNGYEFMEAISNGEVPDLIFMDVLLDGPDGFTVLNELISYPDTEKIPIIIISSLDFSNQDLSLYNVVRVFKKEEMRPEEIYEACNEFD